VSVRRDESKTAFGAESGFVFHSKTRDNDILFGEPRFTGREVFAGKDFFLEKAVYAANEFAGTF